MSSWIIAKSIHKKAVKEITSYHLTTPRRSSVEAKLTSTEEPFSVAQLYLNFIAAAIHMKKLNETCNVWDTTGILRLSIKSNPLINILKQEPSIESCSLDTYKPSISGMKFTELQKHFFSIFEYNDSIPLQIRLQR